MPLTDTQVMEKFTDHEIRHARIDERVKSVESSSQEAWSAIDGMRNLITSVRIQVAGIVAIGGLLQALLTAFLVYKITKG